MTMANNALTSLHSLQHAKKKEKKKKNVETKDLFTSLKKLITKPQIYKIGSCSPCDTGRNSMRE